MRDTDKPAFVKLVTLTLKLYEKTIDTEVMSLWWHSLSKYEFQAVKQAFSTHIETDKFAPKPAHITAIINKPKPDGRPGADEAWGMIPRDELGSCVMTQEMAEAFGLSKGLLDAGDPVAARMTFKESYTRIVEENRAAGIKSHWFPSLGHDKTGRDLAVAEAVRLGRLGTEHAMSLAMKPETLALENKDEMTPEQKKANLARLRMALNQVKMERAA